MGMFDKIKSRSKEFQEKRDEKLRQNAEIRLRNQQEEARIKEGEKIIKSIMGGKMVRNIAFTQKLVDHGISTFAISGVWEKINNQVKSELYQGTLESQDIPNRIDQLVLENANLDKMLEKEEKIKRQAENAEIQKELRIQKEREEALKIGISGFDFKCQLHESRMNSFGNQQQDLMYGYCFVQEDKLVVKKISFFTKAQMGDKIVPYANIKAIDFDNKGGYHITSSIVIVIGGLESIVLKETSEEDFKLLNEAWQNFNARPNTAQIVNNTPQPTNADELLKYAELYKQGLLTEEEFEAKKKELL